MQQYSSSTNWLPKDSFAMRLREIADNNEYKAQDRCKNRISREVLASEMAHKLLNIDWKAILINCVEDGYRGMRLVFGDIYLPQTHTAIIEKLWSILELNNSDDRGKVVIRLSDSINVLLDDFETATKFSQLYSINPNKVYLKNVYIYDILKGDFEEYFKNPL